MQIQKNKKQNTPLWQKQSLLVIAFVVLVSLGASISLDSGFEVKFTLQTLFISTLYFFMQRNWRFLAIGLYLLLGILGAPVFSNGGSGWDYFISGSLGFFLGFIASAYVQNFGFSFQNIFSYFVLIHIIIIVMGVAVLAIQHKTLEPIITIGLNLVPGAVIKSLVGAGITYIIVNRFKIL